MASSRFEVHHADRAREIREIDIVLAYTLVPTGESAFHCFPPPTAEVTLRLTGVRMITKKKPSLYAIRGLSIVLVLGLWTAGPPYLAAQTLEEKLDNLARQVVQLNEEILELRSEVSRSREETRELRLQLSRSDQRSEEHTSELQSQSNLVCRLLLEKKK